MYQNASLIFIILVLTCILQYVMTQLPEWKIPCGAPYNPKYCQNARLETMSTIEDFERCGPAFMSTLAREYVWGGSDNEVTLWANKKAYTKLWIKKRVLRGISNYTTETTVLNGKIGFPVGISPTAGQKVYHPDGEIGVAKAAATTGAIMVLNSLATASLEDVARSVPPGTQLWIQTYTYNLKENTIRLMRRAEAAGYKAIVLTIDESIDGDIRCDARERFYRKEEWPLGMPNLRYGDINTSVDENYNITFSIFTKLKKVTHLPIIAKGIMTAEDALLALSAGATAVMVSNLGGRALDGELPTIEVLPEIVKAVNTAFPGREVYVDGGVRSGQDVFKALALGARAVFVGRPPLWGLAMGGQRGVEKVLNILKSEFTKTLVHAGYDRPAKISSDSVIRRDFCDKELEN